MKRTLTLVPAAFAVVALSMAPAMAKSKNKYHRSEAYQSQQYAGHGWGWNSNYGWNGHQGWNSRNVSDPTFGNRRGINRAYRSGRCVSDLGYGRYEYCGW